MKKKEVKERIQKSKAKWLTMGIGLTLLVLGVVLTAVTRPGAIAEGSAINATPRAAAPITEQVAKLSFPARNLIREISPPPTATWQVRAAMQTIAKLIIGKTIPDFSKETASMEPEDFIKKVIKDRINAKIVVDGMNITKAVELTCDEKGISLMTGWRKYNKIKKIKQIALFFFFFAI